VYELKMAFSHHAYLCAEHTSSLRARVGEMREPPLRLEVVPDPNLEIFFDEILAAPTTAELLTLPLSTRPARAGRGAPTAPRRHQPAGGRADGALDSPSPGWSGLPSTGVGGQAIHGFGK
jgi:hypothetical protein